MRSNVDGCSRHYPCGRWLSLPRAGVRLFSNMGLTDLVTKTSDEYISVAAGLAGDVNRLQSLRAMLRERMRCSPLCDAKRFTAHLEMCYHGIWKTWCESG